MPPCLALCLAGAEGVGLPAAHMLAARAQLGLVQGAHGRARSAGRRGQWGPFSLRLLHRLQGLTHARCGGLLMGAEEKRDGF